MKQSKIVIGILRFTLHAPDSESLKARRQVTAGLLARLRRRFPAAVAEVGEMDLWQKMEVAAAVVSTDGRHPEGVMAGMIEFLEKNAAETVLSDVSTELVRV